MIKMKAYYTDEERNFFWRRRDDENEDDDPDSEMAQQDDADNIYKYANKIEDYYKGKKWAIFQIFVGFF